jgi:hypothetical protein
MPSKYESITKDHTSSISLYFYIMSLSVVGFHQEVVRTYGDPIGPLRCDSYLGFLVTLTIWKGAKTNVL